MVSFFEEGGENIILVNVVWYCGSNYVMFERARVRKRHPRDKMQLSRVAHSGAELGRGRRKGEREKKRCDDKYDRNTAAICLVVVVILPLNLASGSGSW